jgi:hypothetical protein
MKGNAVRFQITHAWPIAGFIVPAGQICDRADPSTFSQIGVAHIPPPDSIPLDAGATNLLTFVYTPEGHTREQFPAPNISNF